MSERKSTNKYYPPDYDPVKAEREARKLSKRLKTMNKDTITIRLMTPFSMRCLKCNDFIPKSRKFNAKKETLPEKYLDKIRLYRFEIRCPSCNNVISFKTNPQTGDYTMDVGGVKNFISTADKNGSEPNKEIPENETLEQMLERLEREQELENEKGQDDGRDRTEIIEEKLAKLQREQEDDVELEKIAEREQIRIEKLEEYNHSRKRKQEDQDTLDDMIAEQAFHDHVVKPDDENGQDAGQDASNRITVVPTKLALKKKKNPLGVKLKRKKV